MNMTSLNDLKEKLVKQFSQLDRRQKLLRLFLILAVCFAIYYNLIYKTQAVALRKSKSQLSELNRNLAKLNAQFPNVDIETRKLEKARKSFEALKSQLASVEQELPTESTVPQLLDGLVRQAQGYSIDFTSIRPKPVKEKREYFEQDIEIKFNTTYADFANYINRLESPSKFLRATSIMMENIKGAFSGGIDVTLTLTTLLGGETTAAKEIKEELAPVAALDIERSPFVSEYLPSVPGAKNEAYRLTGIVASGSQPTAIINDDVYKIGDVIDNKVVSKILSDMVVLSHGKEKIILNLRRHKK